MCHQHGGLKQDGVSSGIDWARVLLSVVGQGESNKSAGPARQTLTVVPGTFLRQSTSFGRNYTEGRYSPGSFLNPTNYVNRKHPSDSSPS